jgi:hypothetical protein
MKIKIMKTKPELKRIAFSIEFYDKNKTDLEAQIDGLSIWFKKHSTDEIKRFSNWVYSINNENFIFKISRWKAKHWFVYKLNEKKVFKYYFSFKSEKGTKFIYRFEEGLKNKIDPPI